MSVAYFCDKDRQSILQSDIVFNDSRALKNRERKQKRDCISASRKREWL